MLQIFSPRWAFGISMLCSSFLAEAQTYPSKTITLLVSLCVLVSNPARLCDFPKA